MDEQDRQDRQDSEFAIRADGPTSPFEATCVSPENLGVSIIPRLTPELPYAALFEANSGAFTIKS